MKRTQNIKNYYLFIKGNYHYIKSQFKYWNISILDFIKLKHKFAKCYCNCLTCICAVECFENLNHGYGEKL